MLVDTDCGVDDALALAVLAKSADLELTQVTSTWGNCTADEAAANAQYVLSTVDADQVPIVAGSSRPHPSWHRGTAHGPDGLGGSEPPRPPWAGPSGAAEAIVQFALDHAGEAELLCIGPLTNLSAALGRAPWIPELFRRVVIVAGHGVSDSEWLRQTGDTNTRHDPAAAQHVADSSIPAIWVGIDVTRSVLLTEGDFGDGKVGRVLRRIHQDYGQKRARAYGYADMSWHVPAHDGVAAVCLADESAAGLVTAPGRMAVVDTEAGPTLRCGGSGNHRVATGIDAASVVSLLRRGAQ
ncbi:nucleoside hydrolase [Rhodococcus sp. NPDC049939]|uniref:nucleoside hydrolase n=1 Tax=Rhodococcus sp. NPDC049939 TaxID=3155511 RepID=UPI0033EBBCAD